MALVREARGKGDLYEWSLGARHLAAGEFDAQPARVVPDSAMVVPPKYAGEVDRVHPDGFGDLCDREVFREALVDQLFRLFEPSRGRGLGGLRGAARSFGDEFEYEAFDREGRCLVVAIELAIELHGERGERAPLKLRGAVE